MASKHPVRQAVESAIQSVVVSELRRRGFRGSFPHFRRFQDDRIDLLTFQFYSSGGKFVVEVANCRADGVLGRGRKMDPKKSTVFDVRERLRLGSDRTAGRLDHWFVYGKPNYEAGHDVVESADVYESLCRQVLELVVSQAEPYWDRWKPENP